MACTINWSDFIRVSNADLMKKGLKPYEMRRSAAVSVSVSNADLMKKGLKQLISFKCRPDKKGLKHVVGRIRLVSNADLMKKGLKP